MGKIQRRTQVLGALAAVALVAVASCGDDNGVERNVLPDGSKGIGLAFAGRHQLNEMWCDGGKCG